MLKTYELTERHFGWDDAAAPGDRARRCSTTCSTARSAPRASSASTRSCYMDAPRKPAMAALIEARVRRSRLVPVAIEGAGKPEHWARRRRSTRAAGRKPSRSTSSRPSTRWSSSASGSQLFFGYDHRFEAYVPKEKRRLGYFALPVLVGDRIVAALDLKTDRADRKLLIQQWTWIDGAARGDQARIEEALDRFERFQFGD